jgi:VWFA-related protein
VKTFFVLSLVFVCLVFSSQVQAQDKDEVIKIDINLVSVPVIVSDRQGRYVSGLKAEDFTVYQDGKKQALSFFGTEEEPLNVAILLDTSKSARDVLKEIKNAAKDFIKLLQPADRAMIIAFDYRVGVLCSLTSDRKELERAIKQVEIGERVGTVMRDAVQEVVTRSFSNVKGRKAIILLTDGKDFGSYPTKAELLDTLEESDVMIYSVFYKTSMNSNRRRFGGLIFGGRGNGGIFGGGRGRRGGMGGRNPNADEDAKDYLQRISDATAGRFYEKDVTDLKITFELIADELRKQYRLGFYPDNLDEAMEVHQLKVKVARADVAVRSRNTYRSRK